MYIFYITIVLQSGGLAFTRGISTITLYILESAFIGSVNLFMLISGYYMTDKKCISVWKAMNLLIEVSIFKVIEYFVALFISGDKFQFACLIKGLIPSNQFVNLYITVYFLSPFIAHFARGLSAKNFKKFLFLSIVLFSMVPTIFDLLVNTFGWGIGTIWTVTVSGAVGGYTIVNYILMFLVGMYLKRFSADRIQQSPLFQLIICVGLIFLWSIGQQLVSGKGPAWSYCNPLIIWLAVLWFFLFKSMTLQSGIVNIAAKSVFVMFLIHKDFFSYIDVKRYASSNWFVMLLHILISGISIYTISWCVWFAYSHTVEKWLNLLESRNKLIISCED